MNFVSHVNNIKIPFVRDLTALMHNILEYYAEKPQPGVLQQASFAVTAPLPLHCRVRSASYIY